MRIAGLDLGQMRDPSALSVLEWDDLTVPRQYRVRLLKRWPLGTPYTTISEGLVRFFQQPEMAGSVLVADETGVGKPVIEMIFKDMAKASVSGGIIGVTITGGHEVVQIADGRWRVPKKNLVSVAQVLLQNRRMHIAEELPEAATLIQELQTFKVKITVAGNETFESWRERDHDDLVLAVILPCWAAETLRAFRPRGKGDHVAQ